MSTELCFNLWYYLTKSQTITAIAARSYMLGGDDEEKGRLLLALSDHDYKGVPVHPIPQDIVAACRGAVSYSALKELGVEQVFKSIFDAMKGSLPRGVTLPDDKLFFATPLFDFGDGNGFVPAEIGDGHIRTRQAPPAA